MRKIGNANNATAFASFDQSLFNLPAGLADHDTTGVYDSSLFHNVPSTDNFSRGDDQSPIQDASSTADNLAIDPAASHELNLNDGYVSSDYADAVGTFNSDNSIADSSTSRIDSGPLAPTFPDNLSNASAASETHLPENQDGESPLNIQFNQDGPGQPDHTNPITNAAFQDLTFLNDAASTSADHLTFVPTGDASPGTASASYEPAPIFSYHPTATSTNDAVSPVTSPVSGPGTLLMGGDAEPGTTGTPQVVTGSGSSSSMAGGSQSAGLIINVTYDASVANAPAAFKTDIAAAVQFFESQITNPITININVGYGEVDGLSMGSGSLGESMFYIDPFTYSQVKNALVADATSANDMTAIATLPSSDPTNGGTFYLSTANAKALGLISGSYTDGYVGFSSSLAFDYNNSDGVTAGQYDFMGTVEHEISEVLGRTTDDGQSGEYTALDLFHYSAPGVRDLSSPTTTGYFSINGGQTDLANFNTNPSGDYGDWAGSVGNDSALAFASPGVVDPFSATDLTAMDAIGYNLAATGPAAPTVASFSPDTGVVGDGITNATVLTLAGTATASSTVNVYDGATLLGTATVNSSGAWSFTTGTLASGSHSFTATDTVSGTTSAASSALNVTVDTTAPSETISSTIGTATGLTPTIASGGLTKDNTLALSGTVSDADGITAVQVYDGATLLGTATVSGSSWSFTTPALANGSHSFTATATDTAGNTTTTTAVTATVDTTAPSETISSTIGTATGLTPTIASGGLTKDNTLALSGTVSDADGITAVQVYDGATLLGTATVSGSSWSFTTAALANGSHSFTATATDTAGNTTTTTAVTATVDTTAPSETISSTIGTATGLTPTIASGGLTKDNTLALSGTVSDADGITAVQVYDGATLLGTATVSGSSWSFTTAALANGSHSFTATATDTAGNTTTTTAVTATVDTTAPSETISSTIGTATGLTPTIASGGLTKDNTLALSGTVSDADGITAVQVYDGATLLGTATVSGSSWSFTTPALANGSHSFTATATDTAGNTTTTTAVTATVDTTAPSETISSTIGTATGLTPTIASGGLTKDNTLALSGTVSDADGITAVQVYDGATLLGTATVSGSSWSFTTPALANGSHSFTATATDTAGNTTTTTAVTATVDTTAPSETISSTIGTATGLTPTIASGGLTKDNTLALSGTVSDADGITSVQVYDGATLLGTATVNGSSWSFTTPALANGSHSFTATATDTAGNTTTTTAVTATVDTTAPSETISSTIGTATGLTPTIASGGLTKDNTLALSGTVSDADGITAVQVYDGATLLGTATVSGSSWSFTTAALANGSHSFTATATDTAGNTTTTAAVTATVDTTAPAAPSITSDVIVNTNEVALTGTAEANSTVQVYDGATLLGSATTNGSGAWSYTTAALANGSHSFTATATDAAGNTGAASSVAAITVNSQTPTLTSFSPDTGVVGDGITNATVLTLAGTATASSTVNVYDGATLLGTAAVNSSGAWSFTTGTLASGSHSFTATDTVSGTTSAASSALNVTVDTTAPSETISSTIGTATGLTPTIASGGLTKDNTLALSGTVSDADGITAVQVYDGATLLGTATVSGSSWSFTTAGARQRQPQLHRHRHRHRRQYHHHHRGDGDRRHHGAERDDQLNDRHRHRLDPDHRERRADQGQYPGAVRHRERRRRHHRGAGL